VGLLVTGEPTPEDVESEGEARASLGPPPPLFALTPPCDAEGKPAAEEANCGLLALMFLARAEDSSWPACGCCAPCDAGKGDEFDETDEVRLRFCLADARGTEAGAAFEGEKLLREGLFEDVVGRLEADENAVDIGVKPRRC